MKRLGQIVLVAGAALLGATGAAAAAGFGVEVGPGGVSVGVHDGYHHHHHWRDWRGAYAYAPDCHWIVHRHWSDYRQAWIVRRERVCD
jgi:hypothetical protein